ncbi:MAG: hypothetical protein PHE43_01625 [Candidatus Nanoarchaeia archaeon]|nr:hypothetical protein [Candidatus Nanoarchaeia archaeon]
MVNQIPYSDYQMKLPKKKDYDYFIRHFSKDLNLISPDSCFYIYGSYLHNCDYGRSDIDGGLILNSGIITPKEEILEISKIMKEDQKKRIPLQLNLLDRVLIKDGRFLAYTTDFTDWIKNKSILYSEQDYRSEMDGKDYKVGTLNHLSFNFRKIRNLVLESQTLLKYDSENFKLKVGKTVEALSKSPKGILLLRTGEIVDSKNISLGKLKKNIDCPDTYLKTLDKAFEMLKNPKLFEKTLKNKETSLDLLIETLEAFESIIDTYLKNFPTHNEGEYKFI